MRAKPRRTPVEDAEDSEQLALEDGDADGSGDVGGSEYMDKLEEELPKAGPLLAETCKKCFDDTYDKIFLAFAAEKDDTVLQQALETRSDKLGVFGTDLAELIKALNASQAVIGTKESSAPEPSLRDLVRQKSDPDGKAEDIRVQRAEVWANAVGQRKKLVRFRQVESPKS